MTHPFEMMRAITSDEEAYEAAGFVMDCVLADGTADDSLGDSAALKPTNIARAEDGRILSVLCAVRPHSKFHAASAKSDDRILVSGS